MSELIKNIKNNVKLRVNKGDGDREYYSVFDTAEYLYPALKPFMSWHGQETEASLLECLLGKHMCSFTDYLYNFFDKIIPVLEGEKSKEISVGDADIYIKLIHKTESKTVFVIKNVCTCADISKWIVMIEKANSRHEIHVRELPDNSDYLKSRYPKKPNLKFWKDRNYICNYEEKHHMTNLGGVYGDIRDNCYVFSYREFVFKKEDGSVERIQLDSDDSKMHYYYQQWRHFMFQINCINNQVLEDQ